MNAPKSCPICGTELEMHDGMPICPQCSHRDEGLVLTEAEIDAWKLKRFRQPQEAKHD